MKHLILNSKEFSLCLYAFKEWLHTLGYSKKSITTYTNHAKELFHYLETEGVNALQSITPDYLNGFTEQLKHRANKTNGGGLSAAHINTILNALQKLLDCLKQTKDLRLHVTLKREKRQAEDMSVLTVDEIKALLQSMQTEQDPVAMRDQCIIALLYGAGLRLSELHQLNIEDISLHKQTLLVSKAKGNKQRLIPLTELTVGIVKQYLIQVRDVFTTISKQQEEALFIDVHGKRIPYFTYYDILKQRLSLCNIESIQDKRIHPHVFRHSIATHLLQAGMDIEDIALFLGHSSLDSTMGYTHLAQTLKS